MDSGKSINTAQLALSIDKAEVQALYSAAGLEPDRRPRDSPGIDADHGGSGSGQLPDQVHRLQRGPGSPGADTSHHR